MAKSVKTEFQPLLSATYDPRFPVLFPALGSFKLDGIRVVIKDGVPYTRSLKKPVPNKVLCKLLGGLPWFDGEVIAGSPTGTLEDPVCNRSQSLVMSEECPEYEDNWTFWIFDYAGPEMKDMPFETRFNDAKYYMNTACMNNPELRPHLKMVHHEPLMSEANLWGLEDKAIALGYEGIMVRQPEGRYKWGRATEKERILTKFKRWEDAEGIITEAHAEQENQNEAKTNALGKTERSSHKANKVDKEVIGGYTVKTKRDADGHFGLDKEGDWVEFYCGAAANTTAKARAELFKVKDTLPGKILTFEYQYTKGVDKPRFPCAKILRADE